MEFLSDLSENYYGRRKLYKGTTYWNWKKEMRGLFHIEINATLKEQQLLSISVQKANAVMDKLYEFHEGIYLTSLNSKESLAKN